jgi:serine/threonine-protein kinase
MPLDVSVARSPISRITLEPEQTTVSELSLGIPRAKVIELASGTTVGPYELLAPLGAGGMSEVWRARRRRGGAERVVRGVAVKVARLDCSSDVEGRRMFHREAEIGATIHHANVVDVLELGVSGGRPYLVMSLVEGPSLAQLAHRTPLPWSITVAVLGDILRGLHAAHEARGENGDPFELVHCDVSPQNVLVGVDGLARICDFGVARVGRLPERRTGAIVAGKTSYFAPEQAMGERLDRRVDVFAAGVVLWELLTGSRLFRSGSRGETLANVLFATIRHPTSVRSSVPRALGDVAMRALARDRSKRFPTARAFGIALASAARSTGLAPSIDDVAAFVETSIAAWRAGHACASRPPAVSYIG